MKVGQVREARDAGPAETFSGIVAIGEVGGRRVKSARRVVKPTIIERERQ